jgi:glycosyltransferase involved in cell wall biosynthesis
VDEYWARPVAPGSAFVPGKLEVLHVVEATTAGVGRHVLDLCGHMRQAGLDVTVACPQVRERAMRDTAFVDRLRAAGVMVVDVPMRYGVHPLLDSRDYGRLVRLMRYQDFDVVHAHSSKAGVLGRLAAQRCRVPAVVYTPNAFAFLGARDRFRRWLYRSVEQWLGRTMTDMLICVSRSEMALARQWAIVPAGHSVTIENAIDASQYAPASSLAEAKLALGLDPDRLVVGYVGRLAAQKGLEVLVQAAQRMLASSEGVQFLLVGEGELERATRQMVQSLGLADHVWFPGYRTDIPRVLAALDVFVLPSLYEGMPYTLLEAMAAGRAIVATDVAGNRDLVRHGETGLLVPPRQARALADAITYLVSFPEERRRLSNAAFEAAGARSSPDQMARQVIEVYAGILERKRTER